MPLRDRRKLLFPAKKPDWASTIPSVYSLSLLDLSSPRLTTAGQSKIASFYQYVEDQRQPRGLKGSRSLEETAIEMLIPNLAWFDTLEDIPKHLSKRLWDRINRRCMSSFHSWKVLSKILRTENDITLELLHFRKAIKSPDSPLRIYTQPLISKTFDFVTSLSISFACKVVELVQLAEISNLGILEITNPESLGETHSSMGDMVLRAWSREANDNGAFSVLRILRLWNHEDLTRKSLRYLRSFPALALFDVRDCGINDDDKMAIDAEKLGWMTIRDMNVLQVLEEKCSKKQEMAFVDSPAGSHSVERRFARVLWPGSKLHRVQRSDVQSFIARWGTCPNNGSITDSQLSVNRPFWQPPTSCLDTDAADWPDCVKPIEVGDDEWASLSWDIFCNAKDEEPCGSNDAACWTRIGELREDRDLILAGVKGIEKQTFVGPHLISPVPMAYLRLGEATKFKEVSSANSNKVVLTSVEVPTATHDRFKIIRKGVHSRPTIDFQLGEARGSKRKMAGLGKVRSLKTQKLDDVLNGFKLD